jgi:YfiH family protein
MTLSETNLGLEIKTERHHIFFGNRDVDLDLLKTNYLNYQFLRIKQTHSAITVEASPQLRDADAHFTNKKNCALVIATADCLPVLIYDKKSSFVASIHAGWKGVANRILPIAIAELTKKGLNSKNFVFFIGPHIAQNSFEVEVDVANQLRDSISVTSDFNKFSYSKKTDGTEKFYINLKSLIQEQILEMGGVEDQIISSMTDTKTNSNWHSYRRDKSASGRNLSFIVSLV